MKLVRHLASSTLLVAVGMLAFPAELSRDILLLRNVKLKMRQNLARIPNYTCLETMVRTTRAPERMIIAAPGKSVPFRQHDVLRIEVAEVDGYELFARPGNHDFKKMSLSELGRGGLIGNGTFSLLANEVFASNKPDYHYFGEETVDGVKLLRFDFRVSQLVSGFEVWTQYGHAVVGYHGSFWADPRTFDAVRLEMSADDVPPRLGVDQSGNRIDFAPVRIGSSFALLPQSGETSMRLIRGWESRNELTFTHCREYGVETTISFGDPNESGATGGGTRNVELPPGLELTIGLDTPVDSEKALAGDPIRGRVEADATLKGKVVVHKDALVSGRLRRLEQHLEGWPYVLVRLEFTEIEFEGKTARFFAELEKVVPMPGAERIKRVATKDVPGIGGLPGVGTVTVAGNRMLLPAGTKLVWKTLSY